MKGSMMGNHRWDIPCDAVADTPEDGTPHWKDYCLKVIAERNQIREVSDHLAILLDKAKAERNALKRKWPSDRLQARARQNESRPTMSDDLSDDDLRTRITKVIDDAQYAFDHGDPYNGPEEPKVLADAVIRELKLQVESTYVSELKAERDGLDRQVGFLHQELADEEGRHKATAAAYSEILQERDQLRVAAENAQVELSLVREERDVLAEDIEDLKSELRLRSAVTAADSEDRAERKRLDEDIDGLKWYQEEVLRLREEVFKVIGERNKAEESLRVMSESARKAITGLYTIFPPF